MTTQISLFDDRSQAIGKISTNGELIVSPISYSTAYHVTVDVALTAFEIVPGIPGKNFIITAMLIATDKTFGVPTTSETLTIYEANPADIDTNLKTLVQIDFLPNERFVATALNLVNSKTRSLIAHATDTNVSVTLSGYYIDVTDG